MEQGSPKQQIRQQILARRSQLSEAFQQHAADRLVAPLQDLLTRHLATRPTPLQVGVYAAMRRELDLARCWPLLQAWPAVLVFPAVSQGRLLPGVIAPHQDPAEVLRPGHFGVPEPPPERLLPSWPELDLILVPGLAFDRSGSRIGWGKAYYDRLLAAMPRRTLRVGVGYAFQVLDQLPSEAHDQRMHIILTPDGWFPVDKSCVMVK